MVTRNIRSTHYVMSVRAYTMVLVHYNNYLPIHFVPLARALWIADFVVGIVSLDEVLHDGARLE
jgi:hypothetical protein